MEIPELLRLISGVPGTLAPQRHIELIDALGRIRLAEVTLQQQQAGTPALHLGALPGRDELEDVMRGGGFPVESRCQAAAVLAQTDSDSALAACAALLAPLP